MRSPLSGLLRRLGEERPHERAQLVAAAVGARRPSLPALADGHGHRHFLLALVAKELVERHGHSSSRPRRSPCLAQVHDDRFHLRVLLDPLVASLADRKSTRLNSSHGYISYAVFCLKKKKKKTRFILTPNSTASQSLCRHLHADAHP